MYDQRNHKEPDSGQKNRKPEKPQQQELCFPLEVIPHKSLLGTFMAAPIFHGASTLERLYCRRALQVFEQVAQVPTPIHDAGEIDYLNKIRENAQGGPRKFLVMHMDLRRTEFSQTHCCGPHKVPIDNI